MPFQATPHAPAPSPQPRAGYASLFVLAAIGGACSEVGVRPISRLVVSPERVTFPATVVGSSREAVVQLESDSATLLAELATTPPFALGAARLLLHPLRAQQVVVRFSPQTPGSFEGIVTVEAGRERIAIALAGEGITPPPCAPRPCHAGAFDRTTGICQYTPLANGAPCADACLDSPACHAGECIGRARGCDDANTCTQDRCEPGVGCVHADRGASCPRPAGPCHAATCDPVSGCGVVNVVDGTRCGDFTCALAKVCRAGACVEETPAEGSECAPATPCRPAGTCRQSVCVQPPPTMMVPEWSYRSERSVWYSGMHDADGNMYWLEPDRGPSDPLTLASMTISGSPRYRVWIGNMADLSGGQRLPGRGHLLLSQEGLILHTYSPGRVQALQASTGRLVWTLDLQSLAGVVPPGEKDRISVGPIIEGREGMYFAIVNGDRRGTVVLPPTIPDRAWIIGFEGASGRLLWTLPMSQRFIDRATTDEAGNLFTTSWDGTVRLHSISPDGHERWSLPSAQVYVRGAFRDRVYLSGSRYPDGGLLRNTADGAEIGGWQLPNDDGSGWSPAPVFSNGVAYTLKYFCPDFNWCLLQVHLNAVSLHDGALIWTKVLEEERSSEEAVALPPHLVLTSRGTILVVTRRGSRYVHRPEQYLREIDLQGNEVYSCPLPAEGPYDAPLVLYRGRIIVGEGLSNATLRAFAVPGVDEATTGWTSSAGGPRRTGRAR